MANLKHCFDRFSFVAQVFDSNETAYVPRKGRHRKLVVYHVHGNAPLTEAPHYPQAWMVATNDQGAGLSCRRRNVPSRSGFDCRRSFTTGCYLSVCVGDIR